MKGTIECPMHRRSIPMSKCTTCQYVRSDGDVSNVWCRYLIGQKKESLPELRDLLFRRRGKAEQMARAYRIGHTRTGDRISKEIAELDRQIKKWKGETG